MSAEALNILLCVLLMISVLLWFTATAEIKVLQDRIAELKESDHHRGVVGQRGTRPNPRD